MDNQIKIITLIEFDYHAEVLLNSLRIFSALPLKINLFTTNTIWSKINRPANKNIDVFLADEKKDVRKLIKENLNVINQSQVIFFNTIASNFKYFSKVNFIPPVILRIHNANAYLNPRGSINPKWSAFYIWKDLSYLILHGLFKLELWYRPKFIKTKVDYFLFPSEAIKEYVLNRGFTAPEKVLPPIPYVFMNPILQNKKEGGEIQITIIGAIDKRRRNYKEVYQAFKELAPSLTKNVKLNLLGKPSGILGKRTIRNFHSLETEKFKVKSFKKFVPQEEFDRITTDSDFLIIPAVKETRYKIFKELYGFTKISGNINDMIIYAKPALIPSFYPVENELTQHSQKYKSAEDLIVLLEDWIEKSKFKSFEFLQVSKEFSHDTILTNTQAILDNI